MTRSVALTDDCARDLDELYAQLHLQGSYEEADRVLDQLSDLFQSLGEGGGEGLCPPELAAVGVFDYRAQEVGHYRVLYRAGTKEVSILLIADCRRDLQTYLERRLLEP